MLNILKTEEFIKLKQGREWEDIRAGDAVEVEKLAYITAPVADKFRGLVISKTNRGSDSAITIINSEYGTNIVRDVVLYSPLIQNIRILQKAFIHKGKKRVRRSKLYYMLDRDPEEYTIK